MSFSLIVLEGAGGAAEINLTEHDIANFRMAEFADAQVLLVADIDRGGVFASLVGTWELLRSEEKRRRIKGFIINKFRGDERLLESGLDFLERRTGVPVLGVVPPLRKAGSSRRRFRGSRKEKKRGAAIYGRCPQYRRHPPPPRGQYTEFYRDREGRRRDPPLPVEPGESLASRCGHPSRNEKYFRGPRVALARGMGSGNLYYATRGGRVVGICGGYQILGNEVRDPWGVEGEKRRGKGLGLLPLRTELTREKVTKKVIARALLNGFHGRLEGYEIHMGRSEVLKPLPPAFEVFEQGYRPVRTDGAVAQGGRIWGTYLHGIFADASFREGCLRVLFKMKGIKRRQDSGKRIDPYDEWASFLWRRLDMARIFGIAGFKKPRDHSWTCKR